MRSKQVACARKAARRALSHYRKNGRNLPWRSFPNSVTREEKAYRIFVSEIMLQQTQVSRVLPKYRAFIRRFPTLSSLARSSPHAVLTQWQGLGYNRRALLLRRAAIEVVRRYGGALPDDPALLEELPGVGVYTARAIAVFAFGKPHPFVETNIRTVFLYHCFSERSVVSEQELLSCVASVLPLAPPRILYAALMDYGAHLKRSGAHLNSKHRGYTKQSPFKGSVREARGAIVRALLLAPATRSSLLKTMRNIRAKEALHSLMKEKTVVERGGKLSISKG